MAMEMLHTTARQQVRQWRWFDGFSMDNDPLGSVENAAIAGFVLRRRPLLLGDGGLGCTRWDFVGFLLTVSLRGHHLTNVYGKPRNREV